MFTPKERSWVIIANASLATIYEVQTNPRRYSLCHQLEHPESRKKNRELTTDRPGHFKSPASARAAFEESSAKLESEARFAKEIALLLEQARCKNSYQALFIIMPPHFQGLLEKKLTMASKQLIKQKLAKDFTKYSPKEIEQVLWQLVTPLAPMLDK